MFWDGLTGKVNTQLFCNLLHSFMCFLSDVGQLYRKREKWIKSTNYLFHVSHQLKPSQALNRLTQKNLKTHASFTGKQHQTSCRKEKTEITILSQETTNIYKKKKLKSQSSGNNLSLSLSLYIFIMFTREVMSNGLYIIEVVYGYESMTKSNVITTTYLYDKLWVVKL